MAKSRCSGCDAPVAKTEITMGLAMAHGDDVYCRVCKPRMEGMLAETKQAVSTGKGGSAYVCASCKQSVPFVDVATDKVAWYQGQLFCAGCRDKGAFLKTRGGASSDDAQPAAAAAAVASRSPGDDSVCDGCGAAIPPAQVTLGVTLRRDGSHFCADCAQEFQAMAAETDTNTREFASISTIACDECGTDLEQDALMVGRAVSHEGFIYCMVCARDILREASEEAPDDSSDDGDDYGNDEADDELPVFTASPDQAASVAPGRKGKRGRKGKLRTRRCSGCDVRIPKGQIARGQVTEQGDKIYCGICTEAMNQIREETERLKRMRGLEPVPCAECERAVSVADQRTGRAGRLDGRVYCQRCTDLLRPLLKHRKRRSSASAEFECEGCDIVIPADQITMGRAVLFEGDYFCEECRIEIDHCREETRDTASRGASGSISCDACQANVPAADLVAQRAHVYRGKVFCAGCAKETRTALRQNLRGKRRRSARPAEGVSRAMQLQLVALLVVTFVLLRYARAASAPEELQAALSGERPGGGAVANGGGAGTGGGGGTGGSGATEIDPSADPKALIDQARRRAQESLDGRVEAVDSLKGLLQMLPEGPLRVEAQDVLAKAEKALSYDAQTAFDDAARRATGHAARGEWDPALAVLKGFPQKLRGVADFRSKLQHEILRVDGLKDIDRSVGRALSIAEGLAADGETAAAVTFLQETLRDHPDGATPQVTKAAALLERLQREGGPVVAGGGGSDPSGGGAAVKPPPDPTAGGGAEPAGGTGAVEPALAGFPKPAVEAYQRGKKAMAERRWADARLAFAEAAQKAPKMVAAWTGIARAERGRLDFKKALAAAERAVSIDGSSGEALIERALLYHYYGRYQEAFRDASRFGKQSAFAVRLSWAAIGPWARSYPLALLMLEGRTEAGHYYLGSDLDYDPELLLKAERLLQSMWPEKDENQRTIDKLMAKTRGWVDLQETVESAHDAYARLLPFPKDDDLIFKICVIRDRKLYDAFKNGLLSKGTKTLDNGFYISSLHVTCVFDPGAGGARTRGAALTREGLNALFGLGAQAFLRYHIRDVPPWLDAGFADYFAPSRPARGELAVGVLPEVRAVPGAEGAVDRLKRAIDSASDVEWPATFFSLATFDRAKFDDPARADLNRAHAWSMIHWLASSDDGRKRLRGYVRALRDGGDDEKAFRAAFGDWEAKQLGEAWEEHVRRLR